LLVAFNIHLFREKTRAYKTVVWSLSDDINPRDNHFPLASSEPSFRYSNSCFVFYLLDSHFNALGFQNSVSTPLQNQRFLLSKTTLLRLAGALVCQLLKDVHDDPVYETRVKHNTIVGKTLKTQVPVPKAMADIEKTFRPSSLNTRPNVPLVETDIDMK